jgi:hypothetical protein
METMKFKVPAGTKEIQIEEVGGQIVTSFIPEEKEFKRGDFVWWDGDGKCFAIILEKCSFNLSYNAFLFSSLSSDNVSLHKSYIKEISDEKKQDAIKQLNQNGLDWDAEKLDVVPYVWTPKIGEVYYTPIITGSKPSVAKDVFNGTISDKYRLRTNRVFRTKELCEIALNKIINILATAKHF